jgi:putative phage-type endonuclease
MNAHEQWLQERRSGIGGSDAAAILGLSKWKTPLEVYMEKRGELAPRPDNESMRWGRVLEPVIRQQYAERTGRVVRVPDYIVYHQDHSFMLANLDGVTDDRRVVEIKTARTSQGWGDPGTDEVPQEYLLQVQHYMAVTGFGVADVAVLIGGSDFRVYEVPADRELQEMLIESEAEFWHRVEQGIPPEPVSYADMQARFGRSSRGGSVEATDEVLDAVARLIAIKAQMTRLEGDEEAAKAIIMKALGECDTLTSGGEVIATWKAAKPAQRFDTKAFQAAHHDLYQQYIKTGEASRRFLLK